MEKIQPSTSPDRIIYAINLLLKGRLLHIYIIMENSATEIDLNAIEKIIQNEENRTKQSTRQLYYRVELGEGLNIDHMVKKDELFFKNNEKVTDKR